MPEKRGVRLTKDNVRVTVAGNVSGEKEKEILHRLINWLRDK